MSLGYLGDSLPKLWCAPLLAELTTPKQWKTIPKTALLKEGFTVYGANGEIGFFSEYTHASPTIMITCRGATCGNLHISKPYSYINGNAMALDHQPIDLVGLKFLYYVLKARGLEDTISGSAQPQITGKGLEAVRVPLPPLAEQKAIADKLDALLAQVEATKARLERIPKILKHFRQSVLASAVKGDLTEEWRKSKGCTFPYINRSLSEVIFEMRNGLSSKPNAKGVGHPILRISSVRPFTVNQDDIRNLEVSKKDEERYAISPDDLLFTRYNGSVDFVGVCARVRSLDHPVLLYPDKLIRVRVDDNQLVPGYLELFAASQEAREYIYSLVKSTSGQKGISGKDLKQMRIKLPSVEEQIEIVRQVDQFFNYAERVEKQVNNALVRINNLTQSILAKAFRGELTEQWRNDNPDLMSGENSAEALLQRIKAERERLIAQNPKRQRRSK
ncbi:restriction endonuclease subunit S [Marinimicrobium agarilyticum]|uniref:restriction endonuclease subunit S n=1 Tax=Marinimicrobium agarilyticum TaxID=306546 RepID=UPI00040A3AB8|nr:restriction endonuclease subunit S [Marinimicrobium agarilyticum]